jgi:hypothetical protein
MNILYFYVLLSSSWRQLLVTDCTPALFQALVREMLATYWHLDGLLVSSVSCPSSCFR